MGHRLLKVNEALREVLSSEITALKDPRVGFVTVTGVEASSDLRHAKVFVSVLGGAKGREQTLAVLRAAHGVLQERIAADVRIKRTPQLDVSSTTSRSIAVSASRRCSGAMSMRWRPSPPTSPRRPTTTRR